MTTSSTTDSSPPDHVNLETLGYTGRWPALLADLGPPDTHARIVRADRGAATAVMRDGPIRIIWRPHQDAPVTGDWVTVDPAEEVLLGIAPRATSLTRPTEGGEQILAANMDLVGAVTAIDTPINVRRLERAVVMAYASGARPVVVLTKADLCPDAAAAVSIATATAPGVDVVVCSTVTGRGLAELHELLRPNRTLALLGASGAGKSTLTNALAGSDVLATAEVRERDRKGRHTTSHREIVQLPGGGSLLDTPGLRTLAIGVVDDELDRAFPEIDEMAAGCRFRDCRHDDEPGCAVAVAVADGALDVDRLEGFRRIRAAGENAALRADTAAYRRWTRRVGRVQRAAQRVRAERE